MRVKSFAGACVLTVAMTLAVGCKACPCRGDGGTDLSDDAATETDTAPAKMGAGETTRSESPYGRKATISKESPREIMKRVKASEKGKPPPGTRIEKRRQGVVCANGLLRCLEIALSFMF